MKREAFASSGPWASTTPPMRRRRRAKERWRPMWVRCSTTSPRWTTANRPARPGASSRGLPEPRGERWSSRRRPGRIRRRRRPSRPRPRPAGPLRGPSRSLRTTRPASRCTTHSLSKAETMSNCCSKSPYSTPHIRDSNPLSGIGSHINEEQSRHGRYPKVRASYSTEGTGAASSSGPRHSEQMRSVCAPQAPTRGSSWRQRPSETSRVRSNHRRTGSPGAPTALPAGKSRPLTPSTTKDVNCAGSPRAAWPTRTCCSPSG